MREAGGRGGLIMDADQAFRNNQSIPVRTVVGRRSCGGDSSRRRCRRAVPRALPPGLRPMRRAGRGAMLAGLIRRIGMRDWASRRGRRCTRVGAIQGRGQRCRQDRSRGQSGSKTATSSQARIIDHRRQYTMMGRNQKMIGRESEPFIPRSFIESCRIERGEAKARPELLRW